MTNPIHRLILLFSALCLTCSGCSNLMYYPEEQLFFTPTAFDLAYEDVYLTTSDGERLHAWWIPAHTQTHQKGTILFLHGNAENMSTHLANVSWLPYAGYNVFALDYRGYGRSSGKPDLAGTIQDVHAAHHWLVNEQPEWPLILLGQSMGASLGISYAGQLNGDGFSAIITDAAFSSYSGIAREKLALNWLTWPFQWLPPFVITGAIDPEQTIALITPTPLLMIHSQTDTVVPFHHGQRLFRNALPPKELYTTRTHHTATFTDIRHRKKVLDFLSNTTTTKVYSPE